MGSIEVKTREPNPDYIEAPYEELKIEIKLGHAVLSANRSMPAGYQRPIMEVSTLPANNSDTQQTS
tara:strand:- start:2496 stop:2693 length:198 start_codon:yes stop_codon:yes gene_type:complete